MTQIARRFALATMSAMTFAWLAPAHDAMAQTPTPAQAPMQAQTPAPASAPAKRPQFVYVLRLQPKYHNEAAWKEADNAAVGRHFQRLKQATEAGQVILAGRTTEAMDKTFGLVIFEADDTASAKAFMENDPAVVAGVMSATLHPYSVALLRK